MNIVDLTDEEKQMDLETRAVLKERVKESTRMGYNQRNVSLMLWLFGRYDHLLHEDVYRKMLEADSKDKTMKTKKGKTIKKRTKIRAVCINALMSVTSSDADSIPIKLDCLSFALFTRFLSTFKKNVPRKRALDDISGGDEEGTENSTAVVDAQIRLSPSSYGAACSALSHLFTEAGISKEQNEITKELWTKLSGYNKGTRRMGGNEKRSLGLSTDEGKKPLPFAAYKYLAKILFESKKAEHVGAHTFLLIAWNLISRAEFVIGSNIDSIWFQADAIMFEVGTTKTDQEGTRNIDHPWHIYSNNEYPYICPMLALARHLIDHPHILAGKCPLFEGSSQYDRYSNIFASIIFSPEHRDTFISLGMIPEQFGTHSIRKGAVTHISTGTTSCPPIASICLRANWKMPGVMNRYIKYENAGDQFVGKCVSGRTRLSKEFAASPAYFDFSRCSRVEKEQHDKIIDSWIKQRMPAVGQSNDKVFALLKMCVASIAYHREFLQQNLHSDSKLRLSSFLMDEIPLAEYVTVAYPWNKTSDTPEITGIPPDVLILAEFEDMRNHFHDMEAHMKAHFEQTLRKELDDREVGGTAFTKMGEMMTKIDQMMDRLSTRGIPFNTATDIQDEVGECIFGDGVELYDKDDDDIVLPLVANEGTIDQLVQ